MADALATSVAVDASAEPALKRALEAVVPEIKAIICACKEKAAGITQASVDKIISLCLSSDLGSKRNVMGRRCGIHPENRAKTGVDAINAQNLTLKISKQGYSETKLENPMVLKRH